MTVGIRYLLILLRQESMGETEIYPSYDSCVVGISYVINVIIYELYIFL